jgi:hypothetical protein
MTERTIKLAKPAVHFLASLTEFPKEKDGLIYVRQSSLAQMRHNIHSFEMQTDKFLEHFRNMGCTGNIEIVADDEAMSGTLAIHQLPGLSRVMDRVEKETVGWIGTVHVNRLTRDPDFVKPALLMKECRIHNVWIATLRMHFNFNDPSGYSQRVFMLEAEEAARHLEWMKLVLGGAKLVASSNGYYDGRNLAPGYIVDRSDPKRMTYMVYDVHSEIVSQQFKRYLELDGNFPLLRREVEAMPYLFPPFEEWVDPRNISRFVIKQFEEGRYAGYYKPTEDGLKSMLTNPVYIGWWIPFEGEVIMNHHKPIVPEDLFWYAHRRLATTNFNGERIKPARVTRQHESEALLTKVIRDMDDYPIYVEHSHGHVLYKKLRHEWMRKTFGFTVSVATIDAMFLEKLFAHIDELEDVCLDWKDTIVKAQSEKEARNKRITKSIKEAQKIWQETMAVLKNPNIPKTEQMQIDLANTCAGLEAKIQEWQTELTPKEEENENQALYKIHTLIPRISREWQNFTYGTKLLVVSGLVRKVIVSRPSSGFLKMEIEWKFLEWGIDTGHIKKISSKAPWTKEEDTQLLSLYSTGEVIDLLRAFPNRNWNGIMERAAELEIRRELTRKACLESMKHAGIPVHMDWTILSMQRSIVCPLRAKIRSGSVNNCAATKGATCQDNHAQVFGGECATL